MENSLLEEIFEVVHRLKPEEQQQVLDFARALPGNARPRGVPSSTLFKFGGLFPKEDLDAIMKAIEEDGSQIDYEEW